MPPSRYEIIPAVMGIIAREQPASILDVGVGGGTWGFLCRQQLEVAQGRGGSPAQWQVTIHGIECFEKYRSPVWDYAYNEVLIGNALDLAPTLGKYEMIILADVLEHLDKEAGQALLEVLLRKASKGLILSFQDAGLAPEAASAGQQDEIGGNPHEKHQSHWTERDLQKWNVELLGHSTYFLKWPSENIWPYARREGLWQEREGEGFHHKRALLSHIPGSTLRIEWEAPEIHYRLMTFPWGGMAKVYINGAFHEEIDLYSPEGQLKDCSARLGENGSELRLELLPTANAASQGTELWFDYAW